MFQTRLTQRWITLFWFEEACKIPPLVLTFCIQIITKRGIWVIVSQIEHCDIIGYWHALHRKTMTLPIELGRCFFALDTIIYRHFQIESYGDHVVVRLPDTTISLWTHRALTVRHDYVSDIMRDCFPIDKRSARVTYIQSTKKYYLLRLVEKTVIISH